MKPVDETVLSVESIVKNGDCAVTVYFVKTKSSLQLIHALCAETVDKPLIGMVNVIPAATSMTWVFAKKINQYRTIFDDIMVRINAVKAKPLDCKTHHIPVCYHPEVAQDLLAVCQQLSLSVDDLIEMHSAPTYQVAMLGFLPGFAYLNDNHSELNLLRKDSPSLQVRAGSVAIAAGQTGIYSLASPGGWHVIACAPKPMFDWDNTVKPMLLAPLDQVVFKPIELTEFWALSG
jgi:inhibitor of KinA